MVRYPLSSYDAEDCYRAIRRLATGKRWSKHPNNESSSAAWATNELNCRRKFFRNVETLNAAKQNVGEALAMAELSLMATSACTDTWYDGHSLPHRSSKRKRTKRNSKLSKDNRIFFCFRNERDSKEEDAGYFSSRQSRGKTREREACRDRVNRARSFQVRRTISQDDTGRNARGYDGQNNHGKSLRRSSSERARPQFQGMLRTSFTGTSPSPVVRHKDLNHHSKDRKSGTTQEGWCRYPNEETMVTDPNNGIRYKKGKLLGKGGFAKCYEFSDAKTKEKFAAKVVSKSRMSNLRTREKILREVEIHRHLDHPNVVAFYGFFESKGAAILILEHCVQRSMVHVLTKRKTLTEPEVRYYMLQLVSGCRYIHGKKIIHRDLKLGNMLLDDQMRIKIADFGLATRVAYEGEKKTSLCGTPNYIAPEVLQKKGHSYEADIWALGCVMYTMLCGQPPFETTSLKETYQRIISSKFTTPGHVSINAAQLISKMLSIDLKSRPSLQRIAGDKFFLFGYTPSTLSTFCCHTAPRFPCAAINERNGSKDNDFSTRFKDDGQNTIPRAKNNHSKPTLETITKSIGSENLYQKKNANKNYETKILKEKQTKQAPNPGLSEIKQSTIAASDSNLRSYEKTFRLYDRSSTLRLNDKNSVRSSEDRSHLVKITDVENCASSDNTQVHQTSDDTKVGEMFEASFGSLYQLMRKTVKHQKNEESSVSVTSSSSSSQSPLWITKWVDYSNKYGFGYQLSDGRVGILFSDSGHILLSPDGKSVTYTSRLNKSKTFSLLNVPSKLQRKLRVVLNLSEYMKDHLIKGGDLATNEAADDGEPVQNASNMVFLQKWYRDHSVILMQLNNGTLQVNFFKDHSKLIITPSSQSTGDYLMTYVCRGRQATNWSLTGAQSSNRTDPEVIERIRLALEVIDQAEYVENAERTKHSPDGADKTARNEDLESNANYRSKNEHR